VFTSRSLERCAFNGTNRVPCESGEEGLRRLAVQIRGKKVIVKLHLGHTLTKLYLLFGHYSVISEHRFLEGAV
jgi:hypothetical protein